MPVHAKLLGLIICILSSTPPVTLFLNKIRKRATGRHNRQIFNEIVFRPAEKYTKTNKHICSIHIITKFTERQQKKERRKERKKERKNADRRHTDLTSFL